MDFKPVIETLKSKRVIGGLFMVASFYLPEGLRDAAQYLGQAIFGVGAVHAGIKAKNGKSQ